MNNKQKSILTLVAAGLIGGAAARSAFANDEAGGEAGKAKAAEGGCKGKQECKGKEGCKHKGECKGHEGEHHEGKKAKKAKKGEHKEEHHEEGAAEGGAAK